MEITCAQCGFKADVPDTYKGKKLCCPQCRHVFICGKTESTFTLMDDPKEEASAQASSKTTSETSSHPASNAPKAEVPIAEYHCGNTQLSLTSRHLMGEIETLVESGRSGLGGNKTYLTRRENISVLLSNISSSTLTDDADVVLVKKKLFRIIAASIFIIILLLGTLVSKINVGTLNADKVIVTCIYSMVPSLIFLCVVKNDLHYYLTIKVMGFEYKIPITNETTKDCLTFLRKLKTAKMAFEESI